MSNPERELVLYHRTAAAEAILRDGFRDGRSTYLTDMVFEGVFVSDVPVDINEGAQGEQLLTVRLCERDIAQYEFRDLTGLWNLFREWCIPARILNESGTTRLLSEFEILDAEAEGLTALTARQALFQTRLAELGLGVEAACDLSANDATWTLWPDGAPWMTTGPPVVSRAPGHLGSRQGHYC